MEALLSGATDGKPKPTLVFVGATVQNDLAATAQQMGWMEDPVTVAVGQVIVKNTRDTCSQATHHSLGSLLLPRPHRYIVCPPEGASAAAR